MTGARQARALRTLHSSPPRFETDPRASEDAARSALDSLAGRTLTGAEWEVAQAKLLQFVVVLRDWNQRATERESGSGNV